MFKLLLKSVVPIVAIALTIGIALSLIMPAEAALAMTKGIAEELKPKLRYEYVVAIPIKLIGSEEKSSFIELVPLKPREFEKIYRERDLDHLVENLRKALEGKRIRELRIFTPISLGVKVDNSSIPLIYVIVAPNLGECIYVENESAYRSMVSLSIGIDLELDTLKSLPRERCSDDIRRLVNELMSLISRTGRYETTSMLFVHISYTTASLHFEYVPYIPIVIVDNFSRAIEIAQDLGRAIAKARPSLELAIVLPDLPETRMSRGPMGVPIGREHKLFYAVIALVDVYEDAYLRPVSISASQRLIEELGRDIEKSLSKALGLDVYVLQKHVVDLLDKLGPMEFAFRATAITLACSAIIVLIIVVRSAIESSILSIRRSIALARSRGVRDRELVKSFVAVFLIAAVVGVSLAYAIAIAIAMASGIPGEAIVFDLPTAIAILVVLVLITVFAIHRAKKVLKSIPVTEVSRYSLLPEALLGKERFGIGTSILFAIGLYHFFANLLGFSAASYIARHPEALSSPSIAVALGILAMIEGVTAPFAPAFFAYGIAKLVAIKGEKLLSIIARLGGASLDAISKGMLMVKKKRLMHIITLMLFVFAILTSTTIRSFSTETMFNHAIEAVFPGNYIATKTIVGKLSDIEHLANSIPRNCIALLRPSTIPLTTAFSTLAMPNVVVYSREGLPIDTYIVLDTEALRQAIAEHGKEYGVYEEDLAKLKTNGVIHVESGYSFTKHEIDGIDLVLGSNESITIAKGIEVLKAIRFPIVGSSESAIVGPWILEKLPKEYRSRELVYAFNVVLLCRDRSSVEELKKRGFDIVKVEDILRDSVDMLVNRATIRGSIMSSSTSMVALLAMGIALLIVLAWSTSLEVKKIYAIMRIRGSGKSKVIAMTVLEWLYIALIGIGLGIAFGLVSAVAALRTASEAMLAPTGSVPFVSVTVSIGFLATLITLRGIGLCISVPLELTISVAISVLLMVLIPLAIVLRVFTGVARERLVG